MLPCSLAELLGPTGRSHTALHHHASGHAWIRMQEGLPAAPLQDEGTTCSTVYSCQCRCQTVQQHTVRPALSTHTHVKGRLPAEVLQVCCRPRAVQHNLHPLHKPHQLCAILLVTAAAKEYAGRCSSGGSAARVSASRLVPSMSPVLPLPACTWDRAHSPLDCLILLVDPDTDGEYLSHTGYHYVQADAAGNDLHGVCWWSAAVLCFLRDQQPLCCRALMGCHVL